MTDEKLIKEWDLLLAYYTKVGYKRFKRALKESINPILSLIDATGSIGIVQGLDLVTAVPIQSAMNEHLTMIKDRTAKYLFKAYTKYLPKGTQMSVGFGIEIYEMAMAEYLNTEGAKHVQEITETTRARVNRAIEKGIAEKETTKQIAKRIERETLGGLKGRIGESKRALLIARTESLMGSARAKDAKLELIEQETGIKFMKEWVHDHPKTSRDWHVLLSGKTVLKKENFKFTHDGIGYSMRYAGDVNGGAVNNCNCRCSTLYRPEKKSDKKD